MEHKAIYQDHLLEEHFSSLWLEGITEEKKSGKIFWNLCKRKATVFGVSYLVGTICCLEILPFSYIFNLSSKYEMNSLTSFFSRFGIVEEEREINSIEVH